MRSGVQPSWRGVRAGRFELDATKTHYTLASVREGGVMVEVAIPGERWEIEFFDDREPEIEIYRSDGTTCGPEKLAELRKTMAD